MPVTEEKGKKLIKFAVIYMALTVRLIANIIMDFKDTINILIE